MPSLRAEEPSIRRIQSKSLIRAVRRRPDAEALLSGCSLDIEAMSSGFDFSWVPMAHHDALTTALLASMGAQAFTELWIDVFTGSMSQKFLSGFTQFLTPLAGGSVVPFARRSPRVYDHLTRGCGAMDWQVHSGGGRLIIEGFPARFDLETWALSNLGSLRAGSLHLGRSRDNVTLEGFDDDARTATFGIVDDAG
ncbi:MAG: hypothetical protein ACE37F_06650 [Nannocystaceae bacterium]|nr:hypothetical protein [bacterium]